MVSSKESLGKEELCLISLAELECGVGGGEEGAIRVGVVISSLILRSVVSGL